jgi:hypothetical protein
MSETVPRKRQQFIFVPTTRQAEAIRALTAERQAVDEHVSQGAVIRELVERGLDVLRVRDDAWASIVATWLKNPTLRSQSIDISNGVLIHEVLEGALGKSIGDTTRGDEMRAATVLRDLGYEPTQIRENGQNIRRYKKVMEGV